MPGVHPIAQIIRTTRQRTSDGRTVSWEDSCGSRKGNSLTITANLRLVRRPCRRGRLSSRFFSIPLFPNTAQLASRLGDGTSFRPLSPARTLRLFVLGFSSRRRSRQRISARRRDRVPGRDEQAGRHVCELSQPGIAHPYTPGPYSSRRASPRGGYRIISLHRVKRKGY